MQNVDIDSIVNYETEYTSYLTKTTITGNQLTSLCPFHDDKNASFSVDLKTGKFHCFACNAQGNYIDFVAKMDCNGDTKIAFKKILDKYGIKQYKAEYSLDVYAAEKRLPIDYLKETFKLSSLKDNNGNTYISMPYFDASNKKARTKKRYPPGSAVRFSWNKSNNSLLFYGLWRITDIQKRGSAILVEGESDTQTLWYLGVPTLGVPGATTFKSSWVKDIQGLKIYLHIEPDSGGNTFKAHVIQNLIDGNFNGELYTFSCKNYDCKDPSELYIKNGKDKAKEYITALLQQAQKINLEEQSIYKAIPDAPKHLKFPDEWHYSDAGIESVDAKGNNKLICKTPIILTQRLKSIDTGEEKIEIAFKRDGLWEKHIFPRSTVFQSKSITCLADLGCTITSENAKKMVAYLGALEAANIDILEVKESTSTFGWQTKNRFIPGHADDMVLDITSSQKHWANGYCANGTLDRWTELMQRYRQPQDNDCWYKFRFMLSAAFAPPLLRIIQQRIFLIYLWGDSKSGKTAALKAAASVWGDPEKLMINFNATQTAIEHISGLFNDLPLCIDERQLAGNNQENIEKLVYMIASGIGRARGGKNGDLQKLQTWRTIAIMTGEEPIIDTTTKTGVSTRTLEIQGKPFNSELDAAEIHKCVSQNFGLAGEKYINALLEMSETEIRKIYEDFYENIKNFTITSNGAHLQATATIAVADCLCSKIIFNENLETAKTTAIEMSKLILKNISDNAVGDVNENAVNYIRDFIASNPNSFKQDTRGEWFGWIEEGEKSTYVYFFQSVLEKILKDAKFDWIKTKKYLDEKEILTTLIEPSSNKKRYNVVKRYNNKLYRVMELNLTKLNNDQKQCQIQFKTLEPISKKEEEDLYEKYGL